MHRLILAATTAMLPVSALAEGVAILPVQVIDKSQWMGRQGDGITPQIVLMTDVLVMEFAATPIEVGDACPQDKTECLLDLVRGSGADRALFVVVQKSGSQITQAFANLVDARDGTLISSTNVSLRGDQDQTWRHAGRFMAKRLRQPRP